MTTPPRPLALLVVLVLPACVDTDDDAAVAAVEGSDGAPVTGTCTPDPDAASDPFVDCVDALEPGGDASFGHDQLPDIVLGPPIGGTETQGSMDVASLGCGGAITLMFDGPAVVDGDGPDLLVFENAFATGEETFAEPGEVLVSPDGERWYAFPCDAAGGWPAPGCAGVTPTAATSADDATDVARAGGDAFDLADLGLAEIRWVRIVDRTRELYDAETWCAGASGGFDLDAIARVAP